MIRVGIVDDQAMIRAGLTMILDAEADIVVVGEASDGDQAVALVEAHAPDVLLMDIRMPRMDGLRATREIRARGLAVAVLILTTFDEDEYVYESLRAGASGFLLKSADGDSLVNAVRVVAAGDALLAPEVTRRVIEQFARQDETSAARPPASRVPEVELSDREVEVLRLLARGLSNQEIATDLFVSSTTVKTHVSHILQKTGARDRVQAVVYAFESGVVSPGD